MEVVGNTLTIEMKLAVSWETPIFDERSARKVEAMLSSYVVRASDIVRRLGPVRLFFCFCACACGSVRVWRYVTI